MSQKTIFQTNWISIKETSRGFQFLERRGKDSVAVFLIRNGSEVLIRQQPLCIDNGETTQKLQLYPCPVTGGLEKGEMPKECAIREVYEETGYRIDVLHELGKYIVGTQTNEVCYLYWADVTHLIPDEATQDGTYFESISRNEWQPFSYLKNCDYAACQLGYFWLKELRIISQ